MLQSLFSFCSILLCILLHLWILPSWAVPVAYVPNPACSSVIGLGCNFNSPIWNISGVPSAGDDVFISVDTQTTIYINNSNIEIASLSFLGLFGFYTIFALYNSSLNLTSSRTSMQFSIDMVFLNDSTIVTPGTIVGTNLEAWGGELNIQNVEISSMSTEDVTCTGGFWNLEVAEMADSAVSLNEIYVRSLHCNDTVFDIVGEFHVLDYVRINNGNVTTGKGMSLWGASIYFVNTWVYLQGGLNCFDNANYFSFASSDPSLQLTVDSAFCHGAGSENNMAILGDEVIANFANLDLGNLTVGNEVTLNLYSSFDYFINVYNISLLSRNTTPSLINIFGEVVFQMPQPLFADIDVHAGNMQIYEEGLTAEGTVKGSGILSMWQGNLAATNIAIREVLVAVPVIFFASSDFNVSLVHVEPFSSLTVNAPKTFISSPGLHLESAPVFFNGMYSQTDGNINVTFLDINVDSPLIIVNGSVSLASVDFYGTVSANSSTNKFVLLRSLTNSISIKQSSFSNTVKGVEMRLTVSKGDLILEAIPPSSTADNTNFFRKHYIYFVISGIVFLCCLAFCIFAIVRRKRNKYITLN